MPSATAPDIRLKVAGTTHALAANHASLGRLVAYARGNDPTLDWTVTGGALASLPDAYLGKAITLEADTGSGYELLFSGRCVGWTPKLTSEGWGRAYQARGLSYLANRVRVINPTDGTDAVRFNLAADDPEYVGALAGRSVGQILKYALEGFDQATVLKAAGVSYGTIPTTPATAHATVSAGVVTVVIDSGGAGYGTGGNAPNVVLVGGGGTYTSATATISSGAVTGVTVSGSTGFTSAPEVWISPLPLVTLQDLAKLTLIPPFPCAISGDRFWDAFVAEAMRLAPSRHVHLLPTGVIRVIHQDDFTGPTTFGINTASDRVNLLATSLSRSVESCFTRVKIVGGPEAVAVRLSTDDTTLEEYFGHSGLTNADAKTYWRAREFTQPGIIAGQGQINATISAGAVNTLTIQFSGYGYAASSTLTLTFTGGGGSGATATATTNASGRITSTSITAGGTGYTTAPTVVVPAPAGGGTDAGTLTCTSTTEVVVTSADATKNWGANFWDQTSSGRKGRLWLFDNVITGIDQCYSAAIVSNTALTAGGTSTLTLTPPLPTTTFDTYVITGTGGPGSIVWRRYRPTDATIRQKLLRRFPQPVALRNSSGTSATLTTIPTASIKKGGAEGPLGVDIDPDNGWFDMERPTVTLFGPAIASDAAAAADNIPDSVAVWAAVNRGQLTATYPTDSKGSPVYAGTAYTVEGIAETYELPMPGWIDAGQSSQLASYAQEVHKALSDAVVEGQVTLERWHQSLATTPGQKIRLSASWSHPWEGLDLFVAGVAIDFNEGTPTFRTSLTISNRNAPLSAEFFQRPQVTGYTLFGDGDLSMVDRMGAIQGGSMGFGGGGGGSGVWMDPFSARAAAMANNFLGEAAMGGQNWLANAAMGQQAMLSRAASGVLGPNRPFNPYAGQGEQRSTPARSSLSAQQQAEQAFGGPQSYDTAQPAQTFENTAQTPGDAKLDDLLEDRYRNG